MSKLQSATRLKRGDKVFHAGLQREFTIGYKFPEDDIKYFATDSSGNGRIITFYKQPVVGVK
ncbi:TPA: hypothetical protein LTY94_004597 [Salmonella enterica subsp. enterica serovar Typhimurium]|uniref:Uncharacterized protein n=2 Tax=root TaxID=1 RepID=A0A9E7SQZ6_9CAUD|nr:hypothetical protein PF619_gp18 [Salmonella phage GRNsp27]EBN3433174.1 hypothetical protein [Salmonella enterica subsp. enterica serovar Newport]ECP2181898.1 hypothetical protein [Salmonella enterica]EEB3074810.1 hypothetical protein [Salmonella enterica subsp. enterica serovar Typhimurium]EJN3045463.1 hypothetical protein [Salmonella enterica]USW07552.1 hypothetical protein [Salmonella phage GRNsp27]